MPTQGQGARQKHRSGKPLSSNDSSTASSTQEFTLFSELPLAVIGKSNTKHVKRLLQSRPHDVRSHHILVAREGQRRVHPGCCDHHSHTNSGATGLSDMLPQQVVTPANPPQGKGRPPQRSCGTKARSRLLRHHTHGNTTVTSTKYPP